MKSNDNFLSQMKQAEVSSLKTHLIMSKLIEQGLVEQVDIDSYVMEENTFKEYIKKGGF